MSSIFSTQNLQTFLRRKNLRPPPPSRGGPPGPRPPPPKRGRSPPGPPPLERGLSLVECSAAFVSSAIILLLKFVGHWFKWPRHFRVVQDRRVNSDARLKKVLSFRAAPQPRKRRGRVEEPAVRRHRREPPSSTPSPGLPTVEQTPPQALPPPQPEPPAARSPSYARRAAL